MTEPSNADLLAQLQTLALEVRAGFAESRARDAELSTRISTLTDAIADLRNDLRGHSHNDD